jgi:hypothetical protein
VVGPESIYATPDASGVPAPRVGTSRELLN